MNEDGFGHSPIGVEDHGFHLIAEHIRLCFRLPDDDLGAPKDLLPIDDAELESRLVHEDMPLAEIARKPAQPFHVENDLLYGAPVRG